MTFMMPMMMVRSTIPGNILYYVPTRTGQQDSYNLSVGLSATWSKPLDKELQEECKEAVATQINLQNQIYANKRLDFELSSLKNCGELMKSGIVFHPQSQYAAVCADVKLINPPAHYQIIHIRLHLPLLLHLLKI